jgi:alanine-glyoxylate transaminase/serine-glyoxylate transaminase/serine-pyruvate transaminase
VQAAGCELVAKEPQYRSHTVSAMLLPSGINARDVVQRVLANDNVRISAGQDTLKATAIRVGHMGPVRPAMLARGVKALARALTELGVDAKLAQAGVAACARVLARGERKATAA